MTFVLWGEVCEIMGEEEVGQSRIEDSSSDVVNTLVEGEDFFYIYFSDEALFGKRH